MASIHYLIFFNHLFFLFKKSSSDKLTKYTTDLAVIKRWVLSRIIYFTCHSPFLTHFPFSSISLAFIKISIYYFASLLFVLFICLSRSSILFVVYYRSFKISSLEIIYRSRTGFTSASVWVTSSSSNARTTWNIPSTYLILLKKWLPKPYPFEAPLTKPAISTIDKTAETSDFGLNIWQSLSNLGSGTGTTALLGSMVQKG